MASKQPVMPTTPIPLSSTGLFSGRISYFKRFRMEIDLHSLAWPTLPAGYSWVAWNDALLEAHADVLFASFHDQIDAHVFPSLGNRPGCTCLMGEIRRKAGFLPPATWLLACGTGYCATVQGVRDRARMGAIQNLGVAPPHRGRGLGTALLVQALHGFRQAGLRQAYLEVTAQNEGAVRLYHRLGFRRRRTTYKAVETLPPLVPVDGAAPEL
jgi:ribosomal protein S18 acetylase RimI-like enzyme